MGGVVLIQVIVLALCVLSLAAVQCVVSGLELEFVTYNYYQSLQVELYWHYWIGRGLVMPVCSILNWRRLMDT